MSNGNMTYEDWLRGCVYHDGRHGEVTLPTDKVLEIANYIQLTRTSQTDGCIELPPYTTDCGAKMKGADDVQGSTKTDSRNV